MVSDPGICCSNCSEKLLDSNNVHLLLNDIQYISNICLNCGYESVTRLSNFQINSVINTDKKSKLSDLEVVSMAHESDLACEHSVVNQLTSSNKDLCVKNNFKVVKKLKDLIMDKMDSK